MRLSIPSLILLLSLICTPLLGFCQLPTPTETDALIKVQVTDFEGAPRPGEQVLFENLDNNEVVTATTDADGTFALLLPEGHQYQIKVKSLVEEKDYDTFALPDVPGAISSDLHIQYAFEEKVWTLDNVFFDTGKATLRPASYPELNELIEVLNAKPKLVIEIAGHTDNQGSDEANQRLSQARANSVHKYLLGMGINGLRVKAKGYGETEPVTSNDTPEGRQLNRRTEVRILAQ